MTVGPRPPPIIAPLIRLNLTLVRVTDFRINQRLGYIGISPRKHRRWPTYIRQRIPWLLIHVEAPSSIRLTRRVARVRRLTSAASPSPSRITTPLRSRITLTRWGVLTRIPIDRVPTSVSIATVFVRHVKLGYSARHVIGVFIRNRYQRISCTPGELLDHTIIDLILI